MISDQQKGAIARVEVIGASEPIRGTAFRISETLVLTAMHVVADRAAEGWAPWGSTILLHFPAGPVVAAAAPVGYDPDQDWALLETPVAPPGAPLPWSEAAGGSDWRTFGFPDANPEGMVTAGRVRDLNARYGGIHTIQLYSEEAAAGQGAPVQGYSGAPVLVQGAVVGLLRAALMDDLAQTVAGTLYACPISLIAPGSGGRLPAPTALSPVAAGPAASGPTGGTPGTHRAGGREPEAVLAGELEALLGRICNPGQLRRWLRNTRRWDITDELPDPGRVARRDYLHDAVEQLMGNNLAGSPHAAELFDRLAQERPGRAAEIRALQRRFTGAAPPVAPAPPQPAQPAASPPADLLDQLQRLLPAQFEEVIFRVGVSPARLSSSGTAQSIRALELLRWVQQRPENSAALQRALDAVR